MMLMEYNEAETMNLFKQDGFREGEQKGIMRTLVDLVKKGLLSVKDAAAQAGISVDAFQKMMDSGE